ncbi:hypothetical protein Syun_027606 [Stephania yunnanensis]|uniref:Uncharacterized protein n=1 Tax=Stephania yunnanensis TaxID=152371 RepID=A0AAP0EFW7_9MAGN
MVSSRTYLLLLHWTSSFSSAETTGAPPPLRAPSRSLVAAPRMRVMDHRLFFSPLLSRGPPRSLTLASALLLVSAGVDLPLAAATSSRYVPSSSFTLLRPRFLSTELPVPSLCRGAPMIMRDHGITSNPVTPTSPTPVPPLRILAKPTREILHVGFVSEDEDGAPIAPFEKALSAHPKKCGQLCPRGHFHINSAFGEGAIGYGSPRGATWIRVDIPIPDSAFSEGAIFVTGGDELLCGVSDAVSHRNFDSAVDIDALSYSASYGWVPEGDGCLVGWFSV